MRRMFEMLEGTLSVSCTLSMSCTLNVSCTLSVSCALSVSCFRDDYDNDDEDDHYDVIASAGGDTDELTALPSPPSPIPSVETTGDVRVFVEFRFPFSIAFFWFPYVSVALPHPRFRRIHLYDFQNCLRTVKIRTRWARNKNSQSVSQSVKQTSSQSVSQSSKQASKQSSQSVNQMIKQ